MFEAAELGREVSKQEYEEQLPGLRVELVNAQDDLAKADFPVVVLLCGDDQLSVRATLRGMHEWMDGRYIESHAFDAPEHSEANRPLFWRYWGRLPRKGRIGCFVNAWAGDPIRHVLVEGAGEEALARDLAHVRRFEQALADDGALLLKLWLHVPKGEYKKRLKRLKKKGKEWHIDPLDELLLERYDEVLPLAERLLDDTSTGQAPWQVIESTDNRYAGLATARAILDALTRRLAAPPAPPPTPPVASSAPESQTVLDTVDLSQALEKDEYEKRLNDAQAALSELSEKAARKGVTSVLCFEGWDAAGKGGTIRRLTGAVDVRDFHVVSIAAPTEEEQAHHYLWRFWNHIPAAGKTVVFDRTWYGRVLVERVEGFAREDEWRRAYAEIRDFEEQLTESGAVVLKFWLHIDADEQLARFQAREQTAFKRYKITDEDYRNRERWHDYEQAVNEMVARTSTSGAPWHLVAANDKRHARVEVIETYIEALRARLKKS